MDKNVSTDLVMLKLQESFNWFLNRMYALWVSTPTNVVILVAIGLILLLSGSWTIKKVIRIFSFYSLSAFVLSLFGITMPSFLDIFDYVKNFLFGVFNVK